MYLYLPTYLISQLEFKNHICLRLLAALHPCVRESKTESRATTRAVRFHGTNEVEFSEIVQLLCNINVHSC